jgi:hypothetical protein
MPKNKGKILEYLIAEHKNRKRGVLFIKVLIEEE